MEGESDGGDAHFPIFGFVVGSLAVPAAAKTNSHTDCHIPPTMTGTGRPNYLEG